METRIHSTCGHARASTARPRGMEINIKSNSGKDLRGVQFPSPRTGQDHHRCPRRRPPKKLPKGTWSRNALLGVSPVCRGCAERCLTPRLHSSAASATPHSYRLMPGFTYSA